MLDRKNTDARGVPAQLPQPYLLAGAAAVDLPCMSRTRIVVLVGILGGCHLQAGFDAASRVNGPLHTLMSQASVTRTDGVTNLPTANGGSYTLEAGFGNQTFTVNSVVAVHDVTSTSFTPGAGYLATTLGADLRWSVLRWKGLSPTIAAGPARMVLVDRTTGDRAWATGIRGGAGVQYQLGRIAICGDYYHEVMAFPGGAAKGTSNLSGVTLGLALQP